MNDIIHSLIRYFLNSSRSYRYIFVYNDKYKIIIYKIYKIGTVFFLLLLRLHFNSYNTSRVIFLIFIL